ncbi:DNA repair ATPase [Streptomyces viridochromogenes]|uniref:DNA repair ATPase n=1 Tax=Streptomyces viridochromogenes TaxID=1938 RepID=UPI00069F6C75|nr:DNA repair ATPase [Streptomyces viridochromogenes]KOG20419.1 hypothetical protein ADK36_16830 [Streptomyces viridochromogenes]KOG22262.1 hypothetical protein ADK35_15440 [Streptomyces viridochromogenes]
MSTPVGRLTTSTRRTEEIASTSLELTSTERLRTGHNRIPRDIVPVGDTLLFGGNVFLALKPETVVGDDFALSDRDPNRLPGDAVPSLLDDPAFDRPSTGSSPPPASGCNRQARRPAGVAYTAGRAGSRRPPIGRAAGCTRSGGAAPPPLSHMSGHRS